MYVTQTLNLVVNVVVQEAEGRGQRQGSEAAVWASREV